MLGGGVEQQSLFPGTRLLLLLLLFPVGVERLPLVLWGVILMSRPQSFHSAVHQYPFYVVHPHTPITQTVDDSTPHARGSLLRDRK
ncbi:uncharacterized [Tachysurus ichikawai]